jgi:hypothetical protein
LAPDLSEIDAAMQFWRQGDIVLENVPFFLHLAHLEHPITPEARNEAEAAKPLTGDSLIGVASQPRGVVVVTQTCDIVRDSAKRPFLEVSPLIEVDEKTLELVKRCMQPRYAYVPGAANLRLVADLDQTMTVEKTVLASLKRQAGCRTDQERRVFAEALARKRARFAFPNEFTAALKGFAQRLKEKHDKLTGEGATLRSLREIRIRAAPSWDAAEVRLTFLFILDADEPVPTQQDEGHINDWLQRVKQSEQFRLDPDLPWRLCFLEDISANEYVESDRLDLDHLSA